MQRNISLKEMKKKDQANLRLVLASAAGQSAIVKTKISGLHLRLVTIQRNSPSKLDVRIQSPRQRSRIIVSEIQIHIISQRNRSLLLWKMADKDLRVQEEFLMILMISSFSINITMTINQITAGVTHAKEIKSKQKRQINKFQRQH